MQCGFERAIGALLASIARPDFVSGMGLMQTAVGGSLEMLAYLLRDSAVPAGRLKGGRRMNRCSMLRTLSAERSRTLASWGFVRRAATSVPRRFSRLAFRGTQESWNPGESMLERARQKVREALAQRPVGLDPTFSPRQAR